MRRLLITVIAIIAACGAALSGPPPTGGYGNWYVFPDSTSQLTAVSQFPSPFVMYDGTPITTLSQWTQHQAEMKGQLEYYVTGHQPPAASVTLDSQDHSIADSFNYCTMIGNDCTLNGQSINRTFHIHVNCPGCSSTTYPLTVNTYIPRAAGCGVTTTFPNGVPANGPFPVIMTTSLGNGSIVDPGSIAPNGNESSLGWQETQNMNCRGYMLAEMDRDEMQCEPQDCGASFSLYPAISLYPYDANGNNGYDWNSPLGWAWGVSRGIDLLFTLPYVDQAHFIMAGVSRSSALAWDVGLMDSRVAMVSADQGVPIASRFVCNGTTTGTPGTPTFKAGAGTGGGGQDWLTDWVNIDTWATQTPPAGGGTNDGGPNGPTIVGGNGTFGSGGGMPGEFSPHYAPFVANGDANGAGGGENGTDIWYSPIDFPQLAGIIAPRLLLIHEGTDYATTEPWDAPGNSPEQISPCAAIIGYYASKKIYQALGVPNNIGLYVTITDHQMSAANYNATADFADARWFNHVVYSSQTTAHWVPTIDQWDASPYTNVDATHPVTQTWSVPNLTGGTPTPVVTGVSPNNGPPAGGTSVIITGSGLTGATAVAFNTTSAQSFTVNSDSSITAVTPAESGGIANVYVTTPGGTSSTTTSDQYTYVVVGTNPYLGSPVPAIAYWNFDTATINWTTPIINDQSTNANNATPYHMTSANSVAGWYAQGLNLGGVGQFISSKSSANPQVFTEAIWFRTTVADGHKLIGFENASTDAAASVFDRMIWLGTDGSVYGGVYTSAEHSCASNTGGYADGTWHHAALTYDGNNAYLYVDGVQQTCTLPGIGAAYNYTGWWHVGGYNASSWANGNDGYSNAIVDDARVYNVALTAAQVLQVFQGGGSGPPPPPPLRGFMATLHVGQ